MKVKILSVSINPLYYNLNEIVNLSYNEAVEFFKKDEIKCCSVREINLDLTREHEIKFHADGLPSDTSDTTLNWVKVTGD